MNNNMTPQISGAGHLAAQFNTRTIGQKHCIQLTKGPNGFGIKLSERDIAIGKRRPINVEAIVPTGAAFKDGRLKEGDTLLEINGIDLFDKTLADVTKMLKEVRVNQTIQIIASRQNSAVSNSTQETNTTNDTVSHSNNHNSHSNDYTSHSNNHISHYNNHVSNSNNHISNSNNHIAHSNNHRESLIDFEDSPHDNTNERSVDGPGLFDYDIPIMDSKSAGLGLYLKYPKEGTKDLGVYIEKVITGGAAWKDGRLRPDDQILAINGINLISLSNENAAQILKAAVYRGIDTGQLSGTIRLTIQRKAIPEPLSRPAEYPDYDRPPSVRSLDEESVDLRSGEERFQRDGFGRQSISEKRHAHLDARNTDTYKRNQKLREKRERQPTPGLRTEETVPVSHTECQTKIENLENLTASLISCIEELKLQFHNLASRVSALENPRVQYGYR